MEKVYIHLLLKEESFTDVLRGEENQVSCLCYGFSEALKCQFYKELRITSQCAALLLLFLLASLP